MFYEPDRPIWQSSQQALEVQPTQPAKRNTRQMRPTVRKNAFYPRAGDAADTIEVGSAAWYAWLERHDLFRFEAPSVSFLARKQKRSGNWYAQRRRQGKLQSMYLGKSEELTLDRLNAVATSWSQRDAQYSEQTKAGPARPAISVPLTSFVGRVGETATLAQLLRNADVRLVSLSGPGGVGKTRLALEVAASLRHEFSDGVRFVRLASISDPQLLLPTIAQELGLKDDKNLPVADLLQASLQRRRVLLVLDNFEQLMPAAPVLVDLLAACPTLKMLITSRSVMHLYPEHRYSVAPLAYPDPQDLPPADELARYPAVELFVQRARAINANLPLDAVSMAAIARICARLDGLPLAIELAAARVKLLPPQLLLPRLEQPLDVLTQGGPDMPARQQTLRATLDWSYNLLDPAEQQLFRRLAGFEGGCSLGAAEAVCAIPSQTGTAFLDLVTSLVDKSLLHVEEQERYEPRLRLLDTVRAYGLECVEASGELESIQQAHASYYLTLAEDAEPQLYGAQQFLWLDRLEQDNQNLRAALRFLLAQDDREPVVRLVGALGWFWCMQGRLSEGLQWSERALRERTASAAHPLERNALYAAGLFATYLGQRERAVSWARESLELCAAAGDVKGFVKASRLLTQLLLSSGDVAAAMAQVDRAIGFAGSSPDAWILAAIQGLLGALHLCLGDLPQAQAALQSSAALFAEYGDLYMHDQALLLLQNIAGAEGEEPGDHTHGARPSGVAEEERSLWQVSWLLCTSGSTAMQRGDRLQARLTLEQARALFERTADRPGLARSSSLLAQLALREHDFAAARRLALEGLRIAGSLDDVETIVTCLAGLAEIAAEQGRAKWAAQLWGAASRYHDAANGPFSAPEPAGRAELIETTRQFLGAGAFAAAWAEGRSATAEQVLGAQERADIAVERDATGVAPAGFAPQAQPPQGLTRREFEVLLLLAAGHSNGAIAERLMVSYATVRAHLVSVYKKLGVSSRTEAMRYAVDHNLA